MSGAAAVEALRQRLVEVTGWDLAGTRGDLFTAGLARAAAGARRDVEAHAKAVLAGGPRAVAALVAEVAVGETYFFRDPAQWEFVERTVIPSAVARRAATGGGLRAWAAGCASGEEPYTLAMLLAERGLLEGSRLVASDISQAGLARARAAEYTQWSLRGGADPRALRWIEPTGGGFRVEARVAAAVTFLELNLATAAYPDDSRGLGDLDLILCRNVLLYLRPEVVADVARRLFECLAPGGWLLTSPSDPGLRRQAPFVVRSGPFGVAYERADHRGVAATPEPAPRPPLRPVPRRDRRSDPSARSVKSAGVARAPAGPRKAPPDACPGCRGLVDSGRLGEALELVEAALRRSPLAPELHLLRALVMADLGALRDAEAACRRAIFLSRDQPFLHFFLATVRLRLRDVPGAAAALRTAAKVAQRLDPNEEIPWSEGMTAAELAAAARWQLERLEAGVPARL